MAVISSVNGEVSLFCMSILLHSQWWECASLDTLCVGQVALSVDPAVT